MDSFKLIIEDDEGKRSIVPVAVGEVTIGRVEGCTIRLNERNVSRNHARLVKDNGSVIAEDLDSYNGVFINGKRILKRQELHEGDLVRIGDFHLELRGEGLQRRSEETTQRTMVPDMESTQPEIRVEDTQPNSQIEEAERAEPTAIIRMEHMQDVRAHVGQQGVLTGARPKLICVSTNFAGQEFEIAKAEVVVGRTQDNDIAIDHRSVSRHHAKIVTSGGSYKIIDLGSANGTLVNGEQYAQLALKNGDVVELGHVKFRFVPPGQTFQLTPQERATIAAGGKTTRAGFAEGEASGSAISMMPGFMDHVRANPFGAIAAGCLVLGVVLLLGWLIFAGDDEGVVPVPPERVPPTTATLEKSDAAKLVDRAREFMEQREWKKAKFLVGAAIEKDPNYDQAFQLMEVIEAEITAHKLYEEANAAIKANNLDAAWNALNEISDASVYHQDSAPVREEVRKALVQRHITHANDALAANKRTEAQEATAHIQALDPLNHNLADLESRLEALRGKRAGGPKPRPTRPRAEPSTPKTPKAEPPPPAPAVSAKSLFREGLILMKSGSLERAAQKFSKCVQVDRKNCECYKAAGIAYAKAKNGPRAARYYRSFVKACPNHKDAAAVNRILDAAGQ